MKITWLGHACFLLEQDGYRLVTDPYTGVGGYPQLGVKAHEAYASHGHHDHNAMECVSFLPPAESPFTVREVPTFHDGSHGAMRGKNTVRIFTAGGVSVAHLGDLGHLLSRDQAEAIGSVDAALVPIGGFYTIDASQAKAVCDALSPRCVVPMHYYHPPFGLPNLGGLEEFLALWPKESVHRLDGASFTLSDNLSGVVVPKFTG